MIVNVEVPEHLYERASAIALSKKTSVAAVFAAACAELVTAWERIARRAQQADREKFLAVLAKVPDVEPEEADRFTAS